MIILDIKINKQRKNYKSQTAIKSKVVHLSHKT